MKPPVKVQISMAFSSSIKMAKFYSFSFFITIRRSLILSYLSPNFFGELAGVS